MSSHASLLAKIWQMCQGALSLFLFGIFLYCGSSGWDLSIICISWWSRGTSVSTSHWHSDSFPCLSLTKSPKTVVNVDRKPSSRLHSSCMLVSLDLLSSCLYPTCLLIRSKTFEWCRCLVAGLVQHHSTTRKPQAVDLACLRPAHVRD